MEILLGIIAALLLEGYKKLSAKYGTMTTYRSIYLGLFAIALGATLVTTVYPISIDAAGIFVTIVLSAVGTYEILLKRLIGLLPSSK